jgi:hypothetical protein
MSRSLPASPREAPQATDTERATPVPDSLVALFERPEPAVAVALPGPTGLRNWSAELGPRRLAVAALVTPLLGVVYAGQAGPATNAVAGGPVLWWALLGLTAVVGALVVATYVPQRRAAAAGSPCGAIAGAYVVFAAWALDSGAPSLGGPVLALGLVSFGLLQRLRGASACG